jgi:hypothetical protein
MRTYPSFPLPRALTRNAGLTVLVALSAAAIWAQQTTVGVGPIGRSEFNGNVSTLPMPSSASQPLSQTPRLPEPPSQKTNQVAPISINTPLAPMPGANRNFLGLTRTSAGSNNFPPDINGDVGRNYYIEAVNKAFAIFDKNGNNLATFSEASLFPSTSICNTNAQGDPVVVYDQFHDRWILTYFAFGVSASSPTSGDPDTAGTPIPPFLQCFAVSKTSDPVGGSWWLYAVRMDGIGTINPGYFNDYGKLGLWNDSCLYYSANEFDENPSDAAFGHFVGVAFASFPLLDMESGGSITFGIGFTGNSTDPFTMIPSNLSGSTAPGAMPPAGTPNYFVSETRSIFAYEVRRFTPGTNCGGGGILSDPVNVSQTSYSATFGSFIPQPGTTNQLDSLEDRIMQKVQYRKVGTAESLWVVHTVQSSSSSPAAPQWAQIDVSGGTISTTPVQQQIYTPDTSIDRWMPSIAVDSQGNVAMGYSTSNGTSPNYPSIAYSGRLIGDPLNQLPQSEVQLIAGAGSQTNTCGSGPCHRWGDYTAMSVDPVDDCTFWYTNEYYANAADGASGNWSTRIGSFRFPSCGPSTVSVSPSGASGAGPQVFNATYSDTGGTGDLQAVYLDIGSVGFATHDCIAVYLPGANQLYLFKDDNNGATGPITLGAGGTLSNSQCVLFGGSTAATVSGNNLTVPFDIQFLGTYGGQKQIFMLAQDLGGTQSNGGVPDDRGTWTPFATTPGVVSVNPSSGGGTASTFVATFSDNGGANDLQAVYLQFASVGDAPHNCKVAYVPGPNQLYLFTDNGLGALGPIAEGAGGGSLSNSQCTLTSGTTAATLSGNNLKVPFNIAFYSGYGGKKTIFGLSQNYAGTQSNGGVLSTLGSWTPATSTPSAVSVSPNIGTGFGPVTFKAVFSDTGGGNDLQVVYLTFGPTLNGANSCAVGYEPGNNTLFLFNDAATSIATVGEGLGGSVSNSQCILSGGSTPATLTGSGNPPNLNVPFNITFQNTYLGNKPILGLAQTYAGTASSVTTLGNWIP